MKKSFLIFSLFVSLLMFSQQGGRDSNRIGIGAGVTQFNIFTKNLNILPKTGWIAGMHVRGNFYNDWQMIYGLQFLENKFALNSITSSGMKEVEYKVAAVQLMLIPSYTVSENRLNLEIGPIFQLNDNLKVAGGSEENVLVDQPTLLAKDVIGVSKFNASLYAGINVGVTYARLRIGYTYGLNNFLIGLSTSNNTFSGNFGYVSGQLTVYL
jgi:hypothetical protein